MLSVHCVFGVCFTWFRFLDLAAVFSQPCCGWFVTAVCFSMFCLVFVAVHGYRSRHGCRLNAFFGVPRILCGHYDASPRVIRHETKRISRRSEAVLIRCSYCLRVRSESVASSERVLRRDSDRLHSHRVCKQRRRSKPAAVLRFQCELHRGRLHGCRLDLSAPRRAAVWLRNSEKPARARAFMCVLLSALRHSLFV